MTNENCLEGMCCPRCGSEEPFDIVVSKTGRMWDDGSEEVHSDEEWDDGSSIICCTCPHLGIVRDFKTPPLRGG